MANESDERALGKTLKALMLINLENRTQRDQIKILDKSGFGQSEIAGLVGSTPKAVSVRLAEIRRAAQKERDQKSK